MNWIKTLSLQVLITLTLVCTLDFLYSKYIFVKEVGKEVRIKHDVFHHTLAPSFNGVEKWGDGVYNICTDPNGFKSSCDNVNTERKQFDLAFMGDSFTEAVGLEYGDSFVGMFANAHPDLTIANLGVSSYSPTIYLSKINWLLERGYKFKHLYVFIDISDIQDETQYILSDDNAVSYTFTHELYLYISDNFKLLNKGYYTIRKKIFGADDNDIYKNSNKNRSTWTSNINANGYDTMGVKGGIENALSNMIALYELLQSHNIKLSVGVYPWPEQLKEMTKYPNRTNKQSRIWQSFCEKRCENFIDLFIPYRDLIKQHGLNTVYETYYVSGDVHFNIAGNQLIYKAIAETVKK